MKIDDQKAKIRRQLHHIIECSYLKVYKSCIEFQINSKLTPDSGRYI